nr:hypothetical protein [Streptomyces sp. SLBN-115]
MPHRGGRREDAPSDANRDSGAAAAAVVFEVEPTFEGVVHRLDQLPHLLEHRVRRSGPASTSCIEAGTSRSPIFGSAKARRIGIPDGVHTGYGFSPQWNREWPARHPWPAHPAGSERFTVGRDIPQGTGVESTIQQSSSRKSLDFAGIRMTRSTRPSADRSRSLQPDS